MYIIFIGMLVYKNFDYLTICIKINIDSFINKSGVEVGTC